jgi:tetratricopeptide (TPR) repeat protein
MEMSRKQMHVLLVCLAITYLSGETLVASEPDAVKELTAANEAGIASYQNANYPEALTSFQKCWALSRTQLTRGTAASNVGATLHAMGRAKEARLWFERSLEVWRAEPNRSDEIARVSLGLADADRSLADFEAADQTLRAAIDARPSADYTAQLKIRLADILREQGRNEDSRRLFRDALSLSGISAQQQIDSLLGLADLDRQMMRWNESVEGWNKALKKAREGGAAKSEALALRGLGLVHLNRGELSQAEPLLKRSLALFQNDPETPPQQLANALHCMGSIYLENRKYTLAEEAFLRALANLKQAVGEDHPQSAVVMQTLAQAYAADNHLAEARQYAAHAYATMCRFFGKDSVSAAEALGSVALIEQYSRDLPGAARDYKFAINVIQGSQSAVDQRVFILMNRYAAVLAGLHRNREANRVRTDIKAFQLR